MQRVKHVVAIHSVKGGVGKSTVAVNLALALAQLGLEVGLLDGDVTGPSIHVMLGCETTPVTGNGPVQPLLAHGIKFISVGNLVAEKRPLIWRGAMVDHQLKQFINELDWGELDVLLVDLPPGSGDAFLTIASLLPLDGAIVVSSPQELSLSDSLRGISGFRELKVPVLGLLENLSHFHCPSCKHQSSPFGDSVSETLCQELQIPFLGRLPLDGAICQSGDVGQPFVLSSLPAALLISLMAERLWTILKQTC